MKKILALVLALTMVLGMGSVALAEGNAQVFWYTMSDTYLASVRTALNAKLDAAGISYVDQDGNATQTTQTDQITTAIATGTSLRPARTALLRTWWIRPRPLGSPCCSSTAPCLPTWSRAMTLAASWAPTTSRPASCRAT